MRGRIGRVVLIPQTQTSMINYSIAMRGVNANLFEINQAKSRIKAAQAAGKTPNSADTALVASEVQNAFAVAQYTDVMTIEKFARHIASHGCVYSRADISAILYLAVDCMREQLLEGKKIRLGDLGDFSVSISSKGAETADKFSAQNITGVNVVWDCGQEFKNLIADAEFNLVASRSAQAAVLKAIKAGQTTVDLTSPDNPSGGGSDGGSTSGGSQTPSGGGSQTPSGGSDSGGSGSQTPSGGGSDSGSGSQGGSSDGDSGGSTSGSQTGGSDSGSGSQGGSSGDEDAGFE